MRMATVCRSNGRLEADGAREVSEAAGTDEPVGLAPLGVFRLRGAVRCSSCSTAREIIQDTPSFNTYHLPGFHLDRNHPLAIG
jgi:hypothetical protein